jgi:hypothetical protein
MRQSFNDISFVAGSADILEKMPALRAYRTFDEKYTEFLALLSAKLLSNNEAKKYPDVITFAFWCRKSNLKALSKPYLEEQRLGRGVAFHIAPSNVPVNFAYSLVTGMLAGNANVVRIPSKSFAQVDIICGAINELLRQFPQIAARLCLVRYAHDKSITDALSSMCISRIIWGGDETIKEIRTSPIPPRANEITFPDRFSVCVINADEYLLKNEKSKIAKDFFNDTYLTDQNACTSPKIIFWTGKERESVRREFWSLLEKIVGEYELQAVQAVDKLTAFYEYAADSECELKSGKDNKIIRVKTSVNVKMLEHLGNSGYFYECDIENIAEILPICTRKLQTVSYIGFDTEELRKFFIEKAPEGVDRIVPVGKTMDFALVWDGVDLIQALSRRVEFL